MAPEVFEAAMTEPWWSACSQLLAAVPAPWWLMAGATLVLWRCLDATVLIGRGWGWSCRLPVAGVCWDLILPVLWLRVWLARSVQWGGAKIKIFDHVPE